MTRKLVVSGGLVAVVLATCLLIDSAQQTVLAQPVAIAPPSAVGRYQISSFVLEGRTPGAYILDTQTGEVMQVIGRDQPVRVGSAAKPQSAK